MKRGLSGRLALDTSALIELTFSTLAGFKLKEALKDGLVEAYTTELSIAELRYILCRRLGLTESDERVDNSWLLGISPLKTRTPSSMTPQDTNVKEPSR